MTKFRKNGCAGTTRTRAEIDKLSKCMEDKKVKALANGIEVWCSFDELVPTERLVENPKNPNRHPEAQVELLAKNIKYFGWRHPVTVSKRSGFIVAGHCRLAAAKKLGVKIVLVDYQDFNSDAEETAVLVADNRLAELSETSEDDLRKILSELDGIVDLELTGFSETEAELLLRDIGSEEVLEEDVPDVSENPLTNFGDVFEFGGHRLMCGDSTAPEQVKKLMDGITADMVFTDPPYNVDYDGNGRKIENDNLGNDFPEFLEKVIKNVFEFSDGAIYICMSSSEIGTLQSVFRRLGGHWSTFVIWAKDTFSLGRSDYHRQYEPILYGWREGRTAPLLRGPFAGRRLGISEAEEKRRTPDYETHRIVRARGVEFVEARRHRARLVRRQRLDARRLFADEAQMPHDGIRAEILRRNPETLSCALSGLGNFAQR